MTDGPQVSSIALRLQRVRVLLVACCLWTCAHAAPADETPILPTSQEFWINSPVMTLEQFRGKAILFWFFEGTHYINKRMWDDFLNETLEVYEDDPIMFIAVNSGNSPADVQGYVDEVHVKWPVIVDVDRSFEKACQIPTITMKNRTGLCYVTHDGAFHVGSWPTFGEDLDRALVGASWKIDSDQIPDSLKATWRSIEFGNFKGMASAVRKAANSPKNDIAVAGKKLRERLDDAFRVELDTARERNADGKHWLAYEGCQRIDEVFKGLEMPAEFADLKKSLLKQSAIQSGTASRKVVEASKKLVGTNKPLPKKTKSQLEKIVADFADSNLAKESQWVIDKASKNTE